MSLQLRFDTLLEQYNFNVEHHKRELEIQKYQYELQINLHKSLLANKETVLEQLEASNQQFTYLNQALIERMLEQENEIQQLRSRTTSESIQEEMNQERQQYLQRIDNLQEVFKTANYKIIKNLECVNQQTYGFINKNIDLFQTIQNIIAQLKYQNHCLIQKILEPSILENNFIQHKQLPHCCGSNKYNEESILKQGCLKLFFPQNAKIHEFTNSCIAKKFRNIFIDDPQNFQSYPIENKEGELIGISLIRLPVS